MSSKTINAWDWDVRVRERNIRHGILKENDVEKMLTALPDVGEQLETLSVSQPAMLRVAPQPAPPPPPPAGEWEGSNNG
jgi:hypothetical protein